MSEALWALGRGTGVVTLLLFTLSIVLGILTRSGRPAFGLPRFAVTYVHRNAALLGGIFVIVHMVSLLADPYAQLSVVDFVVPFLGAVKPLWLGLGTLAIDLALAIIVTALLRQRIGIRVFRFVHWFAYAMWPVALLHAIGNGTDAGSGWFIALAVLCSAAVVGSVIWRTSARFIEYSETRTKELVR